MFATGTTGKLLENISFDDESTLTVTRLMSGPLGGDQQIGSMIADKNLDLVIFLRDPLTAQPHEPDVNALLRLCDVTNTPLATNVASGEILLTALSNNEISKVH